MTIQSFLRANIPHANKVAKQYGIPSLVTLAMAAWESGWGKKAPQYNYFGYTAPTNYSGKRQLLKTVEYHKTATVKYPVIIRIEDIGSKYKYIVKRWFKAYKSPTESFTDYAKLIKGSGRYADAFDYTDDPAQMLREICEGGYATNPEYIKGVLSVLKSIENHL
ncbi:MAG: glucosaminidase domain-containing protein [Paludibacter sp.]